MMECWNAGIMGTLQHSIIFKNQAIQAINNTMDRKNINRSLKKLRVWQDAISLFVSTPSALLH
jgi:hypothetical protein